MRVARGSALSVVTGVESPCPAASRELEPTETPQDELGLRRRYQKTDSDEGKGASVEAEWGTASHTAETCSSDWWALSGWSKAAVSRKTLTAPRCSLPSAAEAHQLGATLSYTLVNGSLCCAMFWDSKLTEAEYVSD